MKMEEYHIHQKIKHTSTITYNQFILKEAANTWFLVDSVAALV
jgi:hypothetical protein